MRISLLSRSLMAATGLAVASATLAALPADAATPSGITRDQVLAAASGVRTDGFGNPPSAATARALRVLANRACDIDRDSEAALQTYGLPTGAASSADGLMVVSLIVNLDTLVNGDVVDSTTGRACIFGALATQDPAFTLNGTATLNYKTTSTHTLSGDAFVTPARSLPLSEAFASGSNPSFSATGNATRIVGTKVATPKTTKQKKAAKKAYAKALKKADASYAKALKKAGDSKKKKAAAKKAYSTKKATAKAKYKLAIATFKIVKSTENRPFSISAIIPAS